MFFRPPRRRFAARSLVSVPRCGLSLKFHPCFAAGDMPSLNLVLHGRNHNYINKHMSNILNQSSAKLGRIAALKGQLEKIQSQLQALVGESAAVTVAKPAKGESPRRHKGRAQKAGGGRRQKEAHHERRRSRQNRRRCTRALGESQGGQGEVTPPLREFSSPKPQTTQPRVCGCGFFGHADKFENAPR